MLNEEQSNQLENLINFVKSKSKKYAVLQGSAGVGKTYLTSELVKYLIKK